MSKALKFLPVLLAALCLSACNSDTGEDTKKSNEEKYLEVKDGVFGAPSPSPASSATPTPTPTPAP